MDNLRSHVKTVHQGKAGIKILEPEEGDEVNIVTVASDDMVTLATEALAATAVTQLTGELGARGVPKGSSSMGGSLGAIQKGRLEVGYSWEVLALSWENLIHREQLAGPRVVPRGRFIYGGSA